MNTMRGLALASWITGVAVMAMPAGAVAQGGTPAASDAEPVYQPPMRGAPTGRIGGGTRSLSGPAEARPVSRSSVLIVALAPDHAGYTTAEQPALYWFLSQRTPRDVEFTLIEAGAVRPLIERRLPTPPAPGLQRIDLADHGVKLEVGKRYQWFVSLVLDPQARSKDVVAGAAIERVQAPAELRAGDRSRTHALARAGLWYDALSAISEEIARAPGDPALRKHRAALLEQVGLQEPAQHDRTR
jgi:hypothetical protein